MVFWIAVLVGGLFAWGCVQVGFYATCIMLFNLVLSAYMAIFLAPVILDGIPATTETPYGYALVLLSVAIGTLVTSYGICYACLQGRLRMEFPKVLDNLAAGLLGFLGGFLVSSFVTFALALTPLREIESLKPLGLGAVAQRDSRSAIRSYLYFWCDMLHAFVSSSDAGVSSEDAMGSLMDRVAPTPEAAPQPRAPQPAVDPKAAAPPTAGQQKAGTPQTPIQQKPDTPDAPTRKSWL